MKKQLLANLKAIDPDTAVLGICYEALRGLNCDEEVMAFTWLKKAFRDWPEFSGVAAYPVRAPGRHPICAYDRLSRWSNHTAYGRARRRLLKFLIRRLEDELR